jgi:hypothetical protein
LEMIDKTGKPAEEAESERNMAAGRQPDIT